jgi:peptidoglycan/LPS O-acetylase OafA/YrhL
LNTHLKSISTQRLAFADLLRGLAALTVALGHFTVLFLNAPDVVAKITVAEPISKIGFPDALAKAYSFFDLASVGVAVFFLISGFVIPLSFEGASARAFLLKRFLRIFPTYWVALATGVASVFVSAAFWSKQVSYTWVDYFANVFLVADFFGRFDIPSVMWTLQIELKFYLLVPLFHSALRAGSLTRLILWGMGVVVAYWLPLSNCKAELDACWSHYAFSALVVAREAMFITYMLIGSVLYAHYRSLITLRQTAFGVAFLFACFVIATLISPFPSMGAGYRLAFFWGAAIFISCYIFRDRIHLTAPFRFLADVSYPLYVIHPLVGYVAMRLLMAGGLPYPPAFVAALTLVFIIATAIHVYVEAPSIALGKRLSTLIESKAPVEQEEVFLTRADQPIAQPLAADAD